MLKPNCEDLPLHYMDWGSSFFNFKARGVINDLIKIKKTDFSNLYKYHALFSIVNKKDSGEFKIEIPVSPQIEKLCISQTKS